MPFPDKILLVHNYYSSKTPSGENRVFDLETSLLKSRGHQLESLLFHSDEIHQKGVLGEVHAALQAPYNPFMSGLVRDKFIQNQPSLVHVHNTFPLISPAIFHAVGKRCPKVLTLHNYRLFCPKAIPIRDDKTCLECLTSHSVLPSLLHGCYRDSRIATIPLAATVSLHRFIGTWRHQVDAFIALSEFQKEWMIRGGLPSEKLHVKPNFCPDTPETVPWNKRPLDCLFVGRLSSEKGLKTLIEAWRSWGDKAPNLRIVGDGILREELERSSKGLPIQFLGNLSEDLVQREMAHSKLLIVPSECIETFGLVVIEAMAQGTPVMVSDEGPLPDLVCQGKAGLVFKARDALDLSRLIRKVWDQHSKLERLGLAGRMEYEQKYTEDKNYQALMEIYDRASSVFRKTH